MLKKTYILSSLFFLNIFFACCFAENTTKDPFPQIKIPIYLGAENINYFIDFTLRLKSTNYMVETAYPATELINFYDRKFKGLGFNDFLEGSPVKGEWVSFQDETKKGQPFIRQFVKCWVDQEKRIEILLALRYETTTPKEWNNKLFVGCQIAPFIEHKAVTDFLKKLEKEGRFESFHKLLEKYSTTDGNIDFEKAIKENPDNQYLREYRGLIRKESQGRL